jgi:hypothetical protein
MLPGGVTETVWHFAGYLKIVNDIARDRIDYDEAPVRHPQDDYTTPRPDYACKPDIDDLDSEGVRPPEIPLFEEPIAARIHPLKALAQAYPDIDHEPLGVLPRLPIGRAGGGGGGGGHEPHEPRAITVQYQDDGEQGQVEIHQYNFMSDDDELIVIGEGKVLSYDTTEIRAETDTILQRMADNANDQIPGEWAIAKSGTGITDFVRTFDQASASGDDAPGAHSVQPGYYLNGELATRPETPQQPSIAEAQNKPDLGHDIGQWAEVGGNQSLNAALIVDLSESGRSMIVMGDYFKTNAIFQTNSTMDHDHVVASGSDTQAAVTSQENPAGNSADNIADFHQHPGIYDSIPAYFAGPHWNVDVVDGDYYSVHTVVQMNYLSDNDIVVQNSGDTHYEVYAGGNELINLAEVFDGTIHYDLIIVAGSYHGMNVIFQNNILLNDDEIKLLANGADPSQSVISGQNELSNTATIENYGDDDFKPMNDGLDSLVGAIGSGATALDPSYGNFIDGSGGVFNVLYIKGDYYDVNAIWQTNVASDVNVFLQMLEHPSDAAQALHPDNDTVQSVTSGKDSLVNDATIVDVGATNTYTNGGVYEDTILVQANLVPSGMDQTLTHDMHALVPELVAFVNETQDAAPAVQPVAIAPAHDDPIANMTH